MKPAEHRPDAEAIRAWLVATLCAELGLDAADIDVDMPLASYGLGSRQAVGLTGDLEEWLGRRLQPTLVFEYPSIAELASYLGDTPEVAPAENRSDARPTSGRIAIIGMSCRLPAADGIDAYWQLLREGGDAIVPVPAERWNAAQWYDSEPGRQGRMNTQWGGFLSGIDTFDPGFFDISPREAASMDPQQRLLLEVAWEALERAALVPDRLAGSRTGVFVGVSTHDYAQLLLSRPESMDAYAGTGGASSIAANRISYWLDLSGPSITIDTACSSSLVAVHLACQSLLNGECDLALAGGVNLILSPELSVAFSQARMMAGGGRCRTFDAAAEGYVRSEGCGVVVLQRLEDAMAEGSEILSVVLGSAVNQDGRSNGLTAPSARAQQAVIREALGRSGIEPARIGYIEAHGTGTPLGDPIEVASLKAVLMEGRTDDRRCAIGSVKTNIGHAEAAAGIAGLLKTVLVLREGRIPPNVHLDRVNPLLELEGTPLYVPRELTPWPNADQERCAGVSSFGFGGTNCHVVLGGPPSPKAKTLRHSSDRTHHVLVVSAKTDTALRNAAGRYAKLLAEPQGAALPDVCFSAATGRAHFPNRLAVTATSSAEAARKLLSFADLPATAKVGRGRAGAPPKIAFLFTGQGSHYAGMGRELLRTQPSFRRTMEECQELLRPVIDRPLLSALEHGADALLDSAIYTQTALFSLGYSLARLWQSWGVEPSAVLGHSLGEYVAATVAGVMSLDDALKLVARRARLVESLRRSGRMAAVFGNLDDVAAVLAQGSRDVTVAAVNGPEHMVIAGDEEELRQVVGTLGGLGFATRQLQVRHAFHSPLLDPILDDFERAASSARFSPPSLELISNITGRPMERGVAPTAQYFRAQMREPVRFADGVRTLHELGYRVFVEMGATPLLSSLAARCLPPESADFVPSLRGVGSEWETLTEGLGRLHVLGCAVDWSGFDRDYDRIRVPLPGYPFERQRCWLASPDERVTGGGHQIWETRVDRGSGGWWAGQRQALDDVMPLSGYVEMILAAANGVLRDDRPHLENLELHRPLFMPSADDTAVVRVSLAPQDGDGRRPITLHSRLEHATRSGGEWLLHATGSLL